LDSFITQAFNGLSLASILLLVSLGLAFAFGLMDVINMAHGEFIMAGAYVAYMFETMFAHSLGGVDKGIWFLVAIPVAFLVTAAMGALLETGLIRFLYGRPLDTLMATWGVGMIMQQGARSIFGAPNVQVDSPAWLNGGFAIGDGTLLPYPRIFIIALSLICLLAIYIYLYRTGEGRKLRAVMQNRDMASCLGVASRRVDLVTFAIGTGLAGVAGCALTLIGPIGPTIGTHYIVDAFMVLALGGVGRLDGAILAALIIGMGNTFLEMSTTATLGKVLIFLVVIAFLQWRPKGLVSLRSR
jgi:urea transport system permease protein